MSELKYENNILRFGNISIDEISEKHQTPFYCYSKSVLTNNYNNFNNIFSDLDYKICFSLKSNSNLSLLRILASLGAGADVVSEWEFKKAIEAGIPPQKIVFSGIGKNENEIKHAIANDCFQINVESLAELKKINQIAEGIGKVQNIGIRINPDVQSDTHEKITTGSLENKFGISVNETLEIFNKTKEFSSLSITAIAFHIGSNIKDLSPFKNSFEVAKNLIDKIQLNYNSLKTIDVGGGISPEERNFSFKDYYDMLISYFDKERFNFIFEPGRLIAADAGILVSKVLYTKISEGKKFIIIDAGMNDMMRPALYDAQHEILTSKLNDSDHNIETEIVGPICESSDKFMRTTKFANIEEGDNVVIKNVGAYGSTMSSNYNARPFIEEILINKDEIQIIRKKQSFDDFIKNEL